jgi:hypothetical protein
VSAVEEILDAVARLDSARFLRLRHQLDDLEGQIWATEQARASAKLDRAGVTDEDIDQMVMVRRRGGRSRISDGQPQRHQHPV